MHSISRRAFLSRAAMLPLAAALPRRFLLDGVARASTTGFRFFTPAQAAVVVAATARLIPGPADDPTEYGHPGAREANVVGYIDTMLAAFELEPARIHAGGPFSDRAGGTRNDLERFVPLTGPRLAAWRARIASLQRAYRDGIAELNARAGGDFAGRSGVQQDLILAHGGEEVAAFRDVLFTHAVEGMYAIPEYGGNADGVGWTEIRFRGDTQPRGYTDDEVSKSDGPDPVVGDELVDALRGRFDEAIRLMLRARGGVHGG